MRTRPARRALAGALALGLTCACTDRSAPVEPETPGAPDSMGAPDALPPLLVDRTEASGLDFVHEKGGQGNRESAETMGGGVGLIDYDGDGSLDVYLVQSGPVRTPGDREPRTGAENALYAGDGAGGLIRVADAAGANDVGYGIGCAVGDANGDGADDLLVLNWGPSALYLARDGRFERAAAGGLFDVDRWSVSAAFFDGDGDGDLDLYVVNYVECAPASHTDPERNPRAPLGFATYPTPDLFPAELDRVYRNVGGDDLFEDVTEASGTAEAAGKGLGVVVTDVDLDGNADVYVANDGTPNFLFRGLGDLTFEPIGRRSGVAYNDDGHSEAGMGVDAGDADGDGDFDLFVTNLDDETNSLYLNSGRIFRDRTTRMSLAEAGRSLVGFGTQFEDFDLDGDLDLLVCNGHIFDNARRVHEERTYAQPNQVFLGDGANGFTFAPHALDARAAAPAVSRGSATGDLDGDGDLDVVIGNNSAPAQLLIGEPRSDESVRIELVGPAGNHRGLGAVLWLELKGGRRLLRRVESARSYASASQPIVVSGTPGGLVAVEVMWPGGARERYVGEALAGDRLRLAFGAGE